MATFVAIRNKKQTAGAMKGVLKYVEQDHKTKWGDLKFVTGHNCVPQCAFTEMMTTKERFRKTDGRQFYHFVQSFSAEDGLTPQEVNAIGLEFAEREFSDFEVVVATHLDTGHLHNHLVVNSVNCVDGKKLHQNAADLQAHRDVNDEICMKHGLSVLEKAERRSRKKRMKPGEYQVGLRGESWKLDLIHTINEALEYAFDRETFIANMEQEGYDVIWTDTRKHITFITPEGRRCRDSSLHDETFPKGELGKESMSNWLQVFKFPSVERTTYDRCECTAEHQIFPLLGEKVISDITAADLKEVLNHWMNKGYAYNTVKKTHVVLNEYFRYLTQQEIIAKNPMDSVPMMKKSNFMAAQNKEDLPTQETVVIFTPEEIEKFKAEAFSTHGNRKPKYQQPAAYILMLNTGLRTGELLGLLNSDINLEERYLEVRQGVKEVCKRDGTEFVPGREVKVGKTKTATSKRRVPLNQAAVEAVEQLRQERDFGLNSPLVSDENGDYTRPVNFRKRYYRILKAAGIEQKGLHSLRHTFGSSLVNGIKQPDGTIMALSPRQVADLLGHSTSQITEMYYVKKDTTRLQGITDGFNF